MSKKIAQKPVVEKSTESVKKNSSDSVALFFIVAYMAMDFIPYTSGVDNIGVQHIYLSVLNLLSGIYLLRNPQLLSKDYFGIFKNSFVVRAYLVFIVLCGLSIFVSSHLSLSIISFSQLLITLCLFVNISILLHNRLHLFKKIGFIVILVLLSQCLFELLHFINLSQTNSIMVALNHLTGNTGSINIFAANLATKIPFLLFGIFTFSKFKRWLSILSLFLAGLLILLTASRASFIGLSLEVFVFIVLLFKIEPVHKVKFGLIAMTLTPLLCSYFTANQILSNSKETQGRFESVNSRVVQIADVKKETSAHTRLSLWTNAIEISKNNPVLGTGIGTWQIESIPYEKYMANELSYSIHTHNDFLEIASETGILNGVVFLLIFIFALGVNLKRIFQNKDAQVSIVAVITILMIITYGIDSIFNFPLHRPAMQYNLALILGLTLVNLPKTETVQFFKFSKKVIASLIVICLTTIFFSYQLQKALLLDNEIAVDSKLPEVDQTLTASYIETSIPRFVEVNLNSVPFYEFLARYYIKEQRYDKANYCLSLSEKINPHSGNSDFYRNKIAQKKGLIDSAYFYTKRALEFRPRNEIYFYEATNMAILKKDTSGLIKLHNNFVKYRNEPKYWVNTSGALILSKYSYINALLFIEKGLKIFPNDQSLIERRNSFEFDFLTNKAVKLEGVKNYLGAIELYKQILKKDPKNSRAAQYISTCYINLKAYNKAIPYLEKALKFDSDKDGKFAFYLGVCYYTVNNKVKGCLYIDQAVQKNYPNALNIKEKYCN